MEVENNIATYDIKIEAVIGASIENNNITLYFDNNQLLKLENLNDENFNKIKDTLEFRKFYCVKNCDDEIYINLIKMKYFYENYKELNTVGVNYIESYIFLKTKNISNCIDELINETSPLIKLKIAHLTYYIPIINIDAIYKEKGSNEFSILISGIKYPITGSVETDKVIEVCNNLSNKNAIPSSFGFVNKSNISAIVTYKNNQKYDILMSNAICIMTPVI